MVSRPQGKGTKFDERGQNLMKGLLATWKLDGSSQKVPLSHGKLTELIEGLPTALKVK